MRGFLVVIVVVFVVLIDIELMTFFVSRNPFIVNKYLG